MYAYITTVTVTAIASVLASAALIYRFILLILRRIKLAHSINLVELKTRKTVYYVFAAMIGFLIAILIVIMAYPKNKFSTAFHDICGADRTLTNVACMFPLMVMISAEAFLVMLCIGKNAIVDKGVYTAYATLDWHQVHDYIIDEDKGVLVLSADKGTFSTLKGLTAPFKVAKTDIQKVKFILNKNRNKFSDFKEDHIHSPTF